jgi:hypothetical protein
MVLHGSAWVLRAMQLLHHVLLTMCSCFTMCIAAAQDASPQQQPQQQQQQQQPFEEVTRVVLMPLLLSGGRRPLQCDEQ